MREINADLIKDTIARLCVEANTQLRPDVLRQLELAYKKEDASQPKRLIGAIIENARLARQKKMAICQDTGLAVVFVRLGQDVHIKGGSLNAAINKGVELGYRQGCLRNSVVAHPILRSTPGFGPCIVHTEIALGNKIRLTVLPKGFGCENKSKAEMFKPTADLRDIEKFIVDVVKNAGPDACPPYIVGVGIGGTQDYACLLAKKALLHSVVRRPPSAVGNRQQATGYGIRSLERRLLAEINRLNIGPMGLGGKTTALAVNIEAYPTHIAGLPVAVNINCHAMRSAAKTI